MTRGSVRGLEKMTNKTQDFCFRPGRVVEPRRVNQSDRGVIQNEWCRGLNFPRTRLQTVSDREV